MTNFLCIQIHYYSHLIPWHHLSDTDPQWHRSLQDSPLSWCWFNALRLRQNGCHFADDIFRGIFMNKTFYILIRRSLKFVPKGPIYNSQALVQIMVWHWIGDKPLSEPILTRITDTYIYAAHHLNELSPNRIAEFFFSEIFCSYFLNSFTMWPLVQSVIQKIWDGMFSCNY